MPSASDRAASAGHGFRRREPARKSQPRKVGGSGSGPVLRPTRVAVDGQNAVATGIVRVTAGACRSATPSTALQATISKQPEDLESFPFLPAFEAQSGQSVGILQSGIAALART